MIDSGERPTSWAAVGLRSSITDSLDDFIAFVEAHATDVLSEARKGFAIHGRGAVVFDPHRAGSPFLQSRYFLPNDEEELTSTALASDIDGYDPVAEMLVGYQHPSGAGIWLGLMKGAGQPRGIADESNHRAPGEGSD